MTVCALCLGTPNFCDVLISSNLPLREMNLFNTQEAAGYGNQEISLKCHNLMLNNSRLLCCLLWKIIMEIFLIRRLISVRSTTCCPSLPWWITDLGKVEGNSLIWKHRLQQVWAWLISDARWHVSHPRRKSSKDHYLLWEVTKKPKKFVVQNWIPAWFPHVTHTAPISYCEKESLKWGRRKRQQKYN